MKIGINASFLRKPDTGIGQVTVNFVNKLIEIDQVNAMGMMKNEFILYLEEEVDLELPKNFTKRVFLPPYKRDDLIRKIWWEKSLLPKEVKKDGCDVLLSLYQCPTILPKKMEHVMLVHDIIPRLFTEYLNNSRKQIYWTLTEKGISRANKIISISRHTEKDLVKHLGISPEKIGVNQIDVAGIFKIGASDESTQKVMDKYDLHQGYIYNGGGLDKRKNVEELIYAYKMLLEENKRAKFAFNFPQLVISGKLMPELAPLITDVEQLVRELNLTKHVKILGFVPQEDLPALYRNSLAFIYPSWYEGFGLPVLEAMNQGAAVITSKKSSIPEVGGDGVLYANIEDSHDLARAMKKMIVNRELRSEVRRRGYERARKFSWDKFVARTLRIIESA